MVPKNAMIVFNDVRFCYDEVCAVDRISFSAGEQKITALVGPNGGGKSTIIKLLAGLIKPARGSVLVKNNAAVGYVPQRFSFDDSFPITVREIVLSGTLSQKIKLFARYNRQQQEKAAVAISRVGLQGYEHRGVNQLSGGQLKRTIIARALASDAGIIVLDEPDSSLDVDAAVELYAMLNKLKTDKTILVASHRIDQILDLADAAVYVNKTAQPYTSPNHLKEKLRNGIVL